MLSHTKAYAALRLHTQESLDFVILACHAVPSLSGYMKAVEQGAAKKLPDPDHFQKPQPHARLRSIKSRYRKTLGRFLFLASFSYFEAYIKSLLEEIFEFHGGGEHLVSSLRRRNLASINSTNKDIHELKRKINSPRKANREQRYKKAQDELRSRGYRFPSDLLSSFGASKIYHQLQELRASEIPELINDGLLFELKETERAEFDRLRNTRNNIAHGGVLEIDFSESIAANGFLRDLAKRIDAHVVKNYLVLEEP